MRSHAAIVIRPSRPASDYQDLVAAALYGFGVTALEEIDDGAVVRVFFADASSRDRAAAETRTAFPDAHIEAVDVSDENWAERSQASLRAVRVGQLTIAPPWDVPSGESEKTIVVLPSMGFGTGHHATTRLCLAALQQPGLAGKTVVDVGTGSGVLAIAAARLGASSVLAVDNDQDAIDNALENTALNGKPRQLIVRCIELDDADVAAAGPFDLVVANLTGGVLIKYAATLESFARPGGQLILSGLRDEEEEDVKRAFSAEIAGKTIEEGWVCLVLRRGP